MLPSKSKNLPKTITFLITKRIILSKVAGEFDPLGLASPFIVLAKILIQDMWAKGLGWDELIDRQFANRARD